MIAHGGVIRSRTKRLSAEIVNGKMKCTREIEGKAEMVDKEKKRGKKRQLLVLSENRGNKWTN